MFPPLIERELRIALLRRRAHQEWMKATRLAGAITLLFMLMVGLGSNRTSGRILFLCLFALALGGVITRGFSLTADLLSEERRLGTLGLLVLAGLGPLEIFVSKLLGALLLTGYGLFGGLPFFAIPFLAGGVSAAHFMCACAFLVNGLLFCVALGLLTSAIFREGGLAQIVAQLLALALCVIAPGAHWLSSQVVGPGSQPTTMLALSPAYPPYLVFTGFTGRSIDPFWLGSAITLAYSTSALLLAALVLRRTWREGPEALAPARWQARWTSWLRGGRNWRQHLRERLINDQPFCWLAARDRAPVLAAYVMLALSGTLWLAAAMALGPRWLIPTSVILVSLALHLGLNFIVAYAAGLRFAEERLSGGFEILLTTPLRADEIVEGQGRAILIQFRVVSCLALCLDLALCAGGLAALHGSAWTRIVYLSAWAMMLALWVALHLEAAARAMWISAWTGRSAYAALKANGRQWRWLALALLCGASLVPMGGLMLRVLVTTSFGLVCLVPFLPLALLLTLGSRRDLRCKLITELRDIACVPIPDRNDRRFRVWHPDFVYPPNSWGVRARPRSQPRGRMDTLNG